MPRRVPIPPLPAQIGPCQLSPFGEKWNRRPLPGRVQAADAKGRGLWDPASRRWLIERRRIGPVLRALRRDTDPLFRQAGIDLDGTARDKRGYGAEGPGARLQAAWRGE
jgi:hypothetical protein